MNTLRIILATAILSLGISGAAYLVKNYNLPGQKSEKENNALAALSVENNNPVQSQPLVEQLPAQNHLDLTAQINQGNYTEEFSKNLAETLVAQNPDGPVPMGDKTGINVPDSNATAENLIAESIKKFKSASPEPIVSEKDLQISSDNSKEALKAYLQDIQKISLEANQKMPTDLTSDYLAGLDGIYQEVIKNFYQLTVPEAAVEIHKKLILVFEKKQMITEKLSAYKSDPLVLIIAMNELSSNNQDFADFGKELANFVEKFGLN